MKSLEIPLGKRKPLYRFLEILPGFLSYLMIALLIILSIVSPLVATVYLFLVIVSMFVKAIGIAVRTIQGDRLLKSSMRVKWSERLGDLEDPHASYEKLRDVSSDSFEHDRHIDNLRSIAASEDGYFPRPSEIYNAVIIAIYNETLDTLVPTLDAVRDTTYDNKRLIVVLAYEVRGGEETKKTVEELLRKYEGVFGDFIAVPHTLKKNEVIGKGGNITNAGQVLAELVQDKGLKYSDVIVTTLDSDNRPHKSYFDCVTYEYIVREDRKHLSYQPVALFMNNIWDVPAPMRVIAVGNTFWNVVSSMRPHTLRNFASHSQPLDALCEIGFWSTRTIVEDGHQYWRSLFYFGGNYEVIPVRMPIYQDAVLSRSFLKTLKAQFIQLRRWDYGASDVAYAGNWLFSKKDKKTKRIPGLWLKWVRLLDGHVTLAAVAPIVAFGGWIPMLLNSQSRNLVVYNLPSVVSIIQTVAMVGIFVTILLSLKMLPPRPARYKKHRSVFMVLQWVLMPITAIAYSSFAAYYSQTRLMIGKYIEKFDVTDKVVKK